MSSDDFPLITDPHAPPPPPPPQAPTRHLDSESLNGGDYYHSYADSDQEKSLSGPPTTPSSKRNHQQHFYHNSNNKKPRSNGSNAESEPNTEYRADYRKDREEWSDTAISCLLEAYTEKYNQLNRGNLRGRDWEEVAEAVSDRGGTNNKKSVEQCKNKIDNLKKRYKVEVQRINNTGGGTSTWHWFKQIEAIVGNSSSTSKGGASGGSGGGGGVSGGESEPTCVGTSGNGTVVVRQAKR